MYRFLPKSNISGIILTRSKWTNHAMQEGQRIIKFSRYQVHFTVYCFVNVALSLGWEIIIPHNALNYILPSAIN